MTEAQQHAPWTLLRWTVPGRTQEKRNQEGQVFPWLPLLDLRRQHSPPVCSVQAVSAVLDTQATDPQVLRDMSPASALLTS